ncbi:hypothetical protein ACFQMM_21745, partial [Saliphagus sp. GCM10025308]
MVDLLAGDERPRSHRSRKGLGVAGLDALEVVFVWFREFDLIVLDERLDPVPRPEVRMPRVQAGIGQCDRPVGSTAIASIPGVTRLERPPVEVSWIDVVCRSNGVRRCPTGQRRPYGDPGR